MKTRVKSLPKSELWNSDSRIVVLKQKPGVEKRMRAFKENSAYDVRYYFNQVQNGNGIHVPSFPKMTLAMTVVMPAFLADLQDRKLRFDCLTFHVIPSQRMAVASRVIPDVESSVLSALSIIAAHDLYKRENVVKIRGPRRAEDHKPYTVNKWKKLGIKDLAFALQNYVKVSPVEDLTRLSTQ